MYEEIIRIISGGSRFLVASHGHPDGDAIGSTLAMGVALRAAGKHVVMYNEDNVPWNLKFLPASDEIVHNIGAKDAFDATFFVDVAQANRIGENFAAHAGKGKLICIDHHVIEPTGFDATCLDGTAASTGEVIYRLLKRLGSKITKDIAKLIFCTIVVDTGSFRYSNTNSSVMQTAKELIEAGADPWEITKNLDENNPREVLDLLREVLKTLEYHMDGKVASIILTDQMLKDTNATVELAEEFINYPRSIAGVEVAVLFRETNPNRYKVSLRSKSDVSVSNIVAKFGGGGHTHAAGCTIEENLASCKEKIFDAIKDMLRET